MLNTLRKRDGSATYVERGDLVYKVNTLYILEDVALRVELIRMHYDDPLAGYFGTSKTTKLISRKY